MTFLGLASIFVFTAPLQSEPAKPNILWLSCEDISPHLGCYSDPLARTPAIDDFASRSVKFSNAIVVAPVCAPCRSSIITAMYPTTIGTNFMRCRAKLPDFVQPFTIPLREAGYYCTNNSKKDYQFHDPPETWDQSSNKAHWRNRSKPEQPFFAVFNFTGTHESQIFNDNKHQATTKVISPADRNALAASLPPYYPDTPIVREHWGRYYDNIAALDNWFAKHLQQLQESGLADDTIIFFWSDHGAGLPRAKRWLYDSGIHVPLIVHVPQKWRDRFPVNPGSTSDQLVCLMDLGPTVLNLAGVPIPDHVQGQPFLGPNLPPPRKYLFAARDRMDERYDIMRAVRTDRYKYIVNFQAWKPYDQRIGYAEQGGIMQEIRRLDAQGALEGAAANFTTPDKPFEEFYDLKDDPHEVHNRIGDPSLRSIISELRREQRSWMRDTLDLGLLPEAQVALRESQYGSRFAILRQPGGDELFDRLLALAESVASRQITLPIREANYRDPDPAVRWWAVLGLDQPEPLLDRAIEDPSPTVQVAAAAVLYRAGNLDNTLPVLDRALKDKNPWLQLEAAIALDTGQPLPPTVVPQMRLVADQNKGRPYGAEYPSRVAQYLLQKQDEPESSQ